MINMNKLLLCFVIVIFPLSPALAVDQTVDIEQLKIKSKVAIKSLGSELKTTLQASMKTKGPIDSISLCNIKAPDITNKVSTEKNITIGRTSLKYRNKDNKPDAWEMRVLQNFEKRKAEGETITSLEFYEIVEQDNKKVFRYMKAIPTNDVCVVCHGENIAPPLAAKINNLYPQDKATGLIKGDIRGAFTVMQSIE